MKRPKVQNYQMLTRIDNFFIKFVSLFPTYTAAGEAFAAIGSFCKKLAALLSAQVSYGSQVLAGSNARAAARNTLKTQLVSVDRTARALNLNNLHWTGKRTTDQALINAGRAFASDAEAVKEQLILHGLAPEFMGNLIAAVVELEAAILAEDNAKSGRKAAIDEFDKILEEALTQVKRVEALVSNTMADNPTVMAAWNTARRMAKLRGSKPSTETATDSPGPPVSGTPPETAASPA